MAKGYIYRLGNTNYVDGKLVIRDPIFLEKLVQSPQQTIEALSEKFLPITLAEIDIDQVGRVVIDNDDFAKLVSSQADGGLQPVNMYCSNATITKNAYPWVSTIQNANCTNITQVNGINTYCS